MDLRKRTLAVAWLALSGAVATAAETSRPPSILLVTIDTWRSDYVGASGSAKVATPFLDGLAADGLYLPQVQATCPLTTPSHASILTGLVPYHHGIRDNVHFRLAPRVETLATLLARAGYATLAVVSGSPLRRIYGLDRGFASYDDAGLLGNGRFQPFVPGQRRGDDTTRRAAALLRAHERERAPILLWVHYYDPHFPYDPPEPYRSRYPRDPYAGEIAFVDDQVRALCAALPRASGRAWTILVTGDHGESLGEHGELTHGLTLYEPAIEVPLILSPRPAGSPASRPASLVDVLPTLCAIAGVAPPSRCDGRSLLATEAPPRYLGAETAYPTLAFGLAPVLSVRRADSVLIHHGADEVYDLAADPGQQHDLARAASSRDFKAAATGQMAALFGADPVASLGKGTLQLGPEERAALKALGYVGGSAAPDKVRAVDMRTFLPDFRRMGDARDLVAAGHPREALEIYRSLEGRYPAASIVFQETGSVASSLGQFAEAWDAFHKALALDPSDTVAALNLGHLSLRRGAVAQAASFYERTLAIDDEQATAQLDLGLIYADPMFQRAMAIAHLCRYLDLAPADRQADDIRALVRKLQREGAR